MLRLKLAACRYAFPGRHPEALTPEEEWRLMDYVALEDIERTERNEMVNLVSKHIGALALLIPK